MHATAPTRRNLLAGVLLLLLLLAASGCSSGSSSETEAIGADEVEAETTAAPATTEAEAAPTTSTSEASTDAPETTAAETTTEAPAEDADEVALMEDFFQAIDAQDYAQVLGLLHPDYAASEQTGAGNSWSAFWVFQTLFDYDGLEDPVCEVGPAVVTCTQLVNDRLARSLDYEFTTSIAATFEDGLIRTAALSSTDEGFFIPLLVWAGAQPDTPCSPTDSPAYQGLSDEEIEASRRKALTDYDTSEPSVVAMTDCVNFIVDNVEGFAALPTSPPLPSA